MSDVASFVLGLGVQQGYRARIERDPDLNGKGKEGLIIHVSSPAGWPLRSLVYELRAIAKKLEDLPEWEVAVGIHPELVAGSRKYEL